MAWSSHKLVCQNRNKGGKKKQEEREEEDKERSRNRKGFKETEEFQNIEKDIDKFSARIHDQNPTKDTKDTKDPKDPSKVRNIQVSIPKVTATLKTKHSGKTPPDLFVLLDLIDAHFDTYFQIINFFDTNPKYLNHPVCSALFNKEIFAGIEKLMEAGALLRFSIETWELTVDFPVFGTRLRAATLIEDV